jgi:hypothetical protein
MPSCSARNCPPAPGDATRPRRIPDQQSSACRERKPHPRLPGERQPEEGIEQDHGGSLVGVVERLQRRTQLAADRHESVGGARSDDAAGLSVLGLHRVQRHGKRG